MARTLFTSESVTEGHPDKMCDRISDAILDELLKQDPMARVACETLTNTGFVVVMGEITADAYVDIPRVVRETIKEIGYTKSEYGFDGNTSTAFYKEDDYNSSETTLTKYSAGIERYDILSNGYEDADNKRGMINLMKSVRYSNAYNAETSPAWYSEFVGDLSSQGYGDLSINSPKTDFEPFFEVVSDLYANKQRDGVFWQTVHTSVYDIDQKMLWVSVQENNEEYKFVLETNEVVDKNATLAKEVFDSFESSFASKTVLPITLELFLVKNFASCFPINPLQPMTIAVFILQLQKLLYLLIHFQRYTIRIIKVNFCKVYNFTYTLINMPSRFPLKCIFNFKSCSVFIVLYSLITL